MIIRKNHIPIPMNLAFFNNSGGEKTEKATPKKRQKARDEGQVAQSKEIGTALILISSFIAIRTFAPWIFGRVLDMISMHFINLNMTPAYINTVFIAGYIGNLFGQILLTILPIALVTMAIGLFINVVQVGWNPTAKPLKPKFSKLNPIKGMKKVVSLKMFLELFKALGKFAVIIAVVYIVVIGQIDMIASLPYMEFSSILLFFGNLYVNMAITVGVMYIFIAAIDYVFNRRKHEKDLKMTKHEVKEEYKQMEGDPLIKGKIRQKMREVSMRRMMGDVPSADVIITNPTHFAVALQYDRDSGSAPRVIAKGADHLARRIREIAEEADVVIVEDKPLARTLYATVDVGQEIPPELFQAVAEVLAYVYKLKNLVPA
ncbi:MAG: flagellar biosynthesis protein FlhB [Defluviitaleaceae bacterium]|nr:flagellar biosynthesis protein FlhB [Defluviitaleaceae bacterium]